MKGSMALSLLGIALLTGGCATGTFYQPAATPDDYGYRDLGLTSDHYRISFAGNSLTPRETVEAYVLYRAAEVTLEAGYDYFRVVSRDTETNTHYTGYTSGIGGGRFWGDPFVGATVGVTEARPSNRYRSVIEIQVGPNVRPDDSGGVYDARDLKSKLGDLVVRAPATD